MSHVTVVIVDDHPAIRAGLGDFLEQDGEIRIVGTAATANAGFEMIAALRPQVAIVDFHLPDQSGLVLCLRLQALDAPPRAVVYSAFATDRLRVLAAVAGAWSVVSKAAPPEALLAAVRGDEPTGGLPAGALCDVGAGLDEGDLAIMGMLCHGVPPAEVAATLSIDERWLAARRWAVVERMTARAPGPVSPSRIAGTATR